MALLVEGLGIGGDTSIEEYIIGPAEEVADGRELGTDKDKIRLYGSQAGLSWLAKPVTGQSSIGLASRHGSIINQSMSLMDPMVTLFGSIHEKLPEAGTGSMRSTLFPNFGSMFSTAEPHVKNEQWDEESLQREGEDYMSDAAGGDSDDNLQSPLISRQTTSLEKDMPPPPSHGSILSSMRRHSSLMQGSAEQVGSTGIGGGWQLAWKWTEKGEEGKKQGEFKRIYLHEEGVSASRRGSVVSVPGEGEFVQAAALVSQPALYSKELIDGHPVGPAMVHPSETASKGPSWKALLEPGVKHALIVGVGIQILQQVMSGYHSLFSSPPALLIIMIKGWYLVIFPIHNLHACLHFRCFPSFILFNFLWVMLGSRGLRLHYFNPSPKPYTSLLL